MKDVQVALYARVSSEQQAQAKTIERQLAEIRTRIAADGFDLMGVLEFVDEGYSGSTLVRPADERNAYYRCADAMNIPRQGFERVCWNKELRMDQTDAAVWQEVCRLLEHPERLEQEYRQRLHSQHQPKELDGLEMQMGKLRRGIARLIDSYADGLIDKQEFEPRVTRMRERMQLLEDQLQRLK